MEKYDNIGAYCAYCGTFYKGKKGFEEASLCCDSYGEDVYKKDGIFYTQDTLTGRYSSIDDGDERLEEINE